MGHGLPWAVTNGYTFENRGGGKASDDPVHTVNWYDAAKWCNARSEKEGRVPAYYTDAEQNHVYRARRVDLKNELVNRRSGYRLPTEAEWEAAARGGLSGIYYPWGNTISHAQANYFGSANGAFPWNGSLSIGFHTNFRSRIEPYSSPVGFFPANGYGLYDLIGNVSEWCWNVADLDYHAHSPEVDPFGPEAIHSSNAPALRIVRGGSYKDTNPWTARRVPLGADSTLTTVGLRCVLGSNE